MTRAVAIVVSCDFCSEPGQPHTITIDGLGERDFDTCDLHAKESGLDDLRTALLSVGRPAGRKVRKAAPRSPDAPHVGRPRADAPRGIHCPWCPEAFVGNGTLLKHVEGFHGVKRAAGTNWPCPVDGRMFSGLQAFGMHSIRAHDMRWWALLLEARREGDMGGRMAAWDKTLQNVSPWPW